MYVKTKKFHGMSLMEVIVAIAIFIISIEGFTLLFVRSWEYNRYIFEMGQASFAASRGVETMVEYIRKARQGDDGAFPLKSADDNDLVLFSDYDSDGITERLHFYKDSAYVKMGVTDPIGTMPKTYPSGDDQVVELANNVVNDSSTPIFYYYNRDYPGDQVNNPMVTPSDVSSVRMVRVYLKVNIDPLRAPENIEMQSFVAIRNLNDYDRIN